MYVPDMSLSKDFGHTYLQKNTKLGSISPKKTQGKSLKVIKTNSPNQQPLKVHTNSQSTMSPGPKGTGTYNISAVIAAQSS